MTEQTYADDFKVNATSELETLHDRTVDTLAGFDKIVAEAEESFLPLATRFQRLHATHAERISRMMADAGLDTSAPGSFMGSVNETVIAARSMLTDIDQNILAQVRSGEQNVLNAFDAAIRAVQNEDLVKSLTEMRDELADLVNRTRDQG